MKSNTLIFLFIQLLFIFTCSPQKEETKVKSVDTFTSEPYIIVLGVAQDAGYPQAACKKECCQKVWSGQQEKKLVSCLAVVDPISNQTWLLDATPDFKEQLHRLEQLNAKNPFNLAGIFLTHAHIGHYTGLMHLGHEVMGAKNIPVYSMPRMQDFLTNNGPWSQLVSFKNIKLVALEKETPIQITEQISITPIQVPHRDEFSETVGFSIKGPNKTALFIPDIDKWHLWDKDILKEIQATDFAFLDGTFFENGEIPGRDMSQIPHPFISESMDVFSTLTDQNKAKVHFIHFNHTNPVLQDNSKAQQTVQQKGFNIAKEMQIIPL